MDCTGIADVGQRPCTSWFHFYHLMKIVALISEMVPVNFEKCCSAALYQK